jgi:hypothetical protein
MSDNNNNGNGKSAPSASSVNKYKVKPVEKVLENPSNMDEPAKRKSFLKSVSDDSSKFIHGIQHSVSISLQKAKSVKVKFKFHAPELPDEDDFIQLRKKLSKFVKLASWCFDSSVENFPIGGAIGLGMTIFSCILISGAMYRIRSIVLMYDTEGVVLQYFGYYVFGIVFFIAVHSAVFLHGISVGVVETERELCGNTKAGNCCFYSCCCCCRKKSKCGICCKIVEKFAQRSCQLIWALLGTVLLLAMYIVGLAMFLVSTLTTSTSYGLTYSCGLFEALLQKYMKVSQDYIATAKQHLTSTDSVISGILESYSSWNNLKDQYSNSAVGQLGQVSGIAAGGSSSGASISAPRTSYDSTSASASIPRRLSQTTGTSFDPKLSLAQGQSMVQVLNASIYDTEEQLAYYDEQSQVLIQYCRDVSSLYDAFLYILIASIVILFSELLMFAVHTKYFSAWNYEMELMDQENERKQLEKKILQMESLIDKSSSVADNNHSNEHTET